MIDVAAKQAPIEAHRNQWSPYQDNGGSCLAVAGENYAVIAADTRTSVGYSIHTRDFSKVTQLTSKCCIVTAGQQSEMVTLHKRLKMMVVTYTQRHHCEPNVKSIGQLLSYVLYGKRFFPYYTFNLLVGVDEEGKGYVYNYDAIGSVDSVSYSAQGSGKLLMYSVLDNQVGQTNQSIKGAKPSKEEVINLCKDVITSTAERDIYTGDVAEIFVIDASGVSVSKLQMRID